MANKSDLRVVLGVDGEAEFTRKMDKIAKQQKEIASQIRLATSALGANATAYDKAKASVQGLTEQVASQQKKVDELRRVYERAAAEQGELAEETIKLKTDYQNAEATLNSYKKKLEEANKTLAEHESKLGQASEKLEKFGKTATKVGEGMQSVGNSMTKHLTAPILAAGTAAAKSAMDYESAFAGVKKTVDATDEEYQKISDDILDMSTKLATSATEIAGVAEAAGQLGISKDDISAFTEVMIELGMSTNLSAEEAAMQLAKFANITGMSTSRYKNLGSVIVELGNSFQTTEADIVAMATKLASTGSVVGYTEPQMMAIAAALSSVGIEAEAGGTAFSKLSKELALAVANGGKKLDQFADVAGLSASEFKKAYETDALGALNLFINGLNDTERLGKSSISILSEMGITEVRMSNAVLALASSEDILGKALEAANAEWEEGDALQNEADKRLETIESQLKNAKSELEKTAIILSNDFLPMIADVAKSIGEVAEKFGELDPKTQKTIIKFALVVASAGPVISTLGKLKSGIGTLTSAGSKALKTFSSIKAGTYTGPLSNLISKLTGATSATGELAGASTGLAGTLSASGPLIVGIAAAAAVAGGLYLAYRKSTEGQRELDAAMKEFCEGFGEFDEMVNSATSLLNGLSDAALGVSSAEKQMLNQGIEEVQKNITEIAQRAMEERRDLTQAEIDRLNELFGKLNELTEQELEYAQKQQNIAMAMAQVEDDITQESAAKLVATAQSAKDQVVELANKQYAEKVALAYQAFEETGEITQAEYDEQVRIAKESYDAAINAANQKYGDTVAIVTNAYTDENVLNNQHFNDFTSHLEELRALQENYNEEIKIIHSNRFLTSEQMYAQELAASEKLRQGNNKIYAEMASELEQLNDDELQTWIELVTNTEVYGGELSGSAKDLADKFVAALDEMPEDSKEAFKNAMQGMIDGIEEKEPSLFDKAKNLANGFINRIRNTFEIASPSKVMKRLFKFVVEGGEVGVDEEGPSLIDSAESLSEEFVKQFEGINPQMGASLRLNVQQLQRLNLNDALAGVQQYKQIVNNMTHNEQRTSEIFNTTNNHNIAKDAINGIRIENMTVKSENDIKKLTDMVVKELVRMFEAEGVKL